VAGRAVVGDDPIYGQRAFALREPVELVAFAGLGQVTAVVAQGFMRLRAAGHRAMRRAGIAQPWRAAIGGSSLARSSRSSRPSPATATSRSTRC
jgi:H+/Cl- antiporter ClcA